MRPCRRPRGRREAAAPAASRRTAGRPRLALLARVDDVLGGRPCTPRSAELPASCDGEAADARVEGVVGERCAGEAQRRGRVGAGAVGDRRAGGGR